MRGFHRGHGFHRIWFRGCCRFKTICGNQFLLGKDVFAQFLTEPVHPVSEIAIKHVADLRHPRHPLAVAAEIRMRKLRQPAATTLQRQTDRLYSFLTYAKAHGKLSNQ